MTIERAKEIVQIGFAWANWTSEQKEAFRTLLLEVEKCRQLEAENEHLTHILFVLRQPCEQQEQLLAEHKISGVDTLTFFRDILESKYDCENIKAKSP